MSTTMLHMRTAVVFAASSACIGYYWGKQTHQLSRETENVSLFPSLNAKSSLPPVRLDSASQQGQDAVKTPPPPPPGTVGQMVKYGFPSTDNLRSYEDFLLSYDRRTRTANWVLEHLTADRVTKIESVERSKMKFMEDASIHEFHRATNKDYQGSGYDRGHLAAAANHRHSTSAMNQTFLLSNTAPQVGEGFNRDAWNNLEKYVRALTRNNKNVYVCTGPLYLPRREPDGKVYVKYEVIGPNHVAVPTHFFKVILIETEKGLLELQSYIMPNEKLPDVRLHHYLQPLETIERAAGLNFFQHIPKASFSKINVVKGNT